MSISSKDRSRLKDKLRDNLQKSKIKVKKASKEDIKEELKIGLKRESEDKKSQEISNNRLYSEIKLKLESIVGSEAFITNLFNFVLKEAEVFDKEKHINLIKLLMQTLKELGTTETSNPDSDKIFTVLRENMIDFLYKFKDLHPSSNSESWRAMDVFDIIMDFMQDHGIQPSESLKSIYAQSKLTKQLNEFPTREYLCEKCEVEMKEEDYNRLKEIYESKPPFVFYFMPKIEPRIKISSYLYMVGFFQKGMLDKQMGAGMLISMEGSMHQGYYKNDRWHYNGRFISTEGDVYEGGYDSGVVHGRGEMQYSEDGRKETGYWVRDVKQGKFTVTDSQGNVLKKTYLDDEEVEDE